MPANLKLTFLLIGLLFPGQLSLAQHVTKNNYTGSWTNPNSWSPVWPVPEMDNIQETVTINGLITASGALTLNGSANDLIINDTLIIEGALTLGNNNRLIINDNGLVIIRGDLVINNQTSIAANGYLVITNVLKTGSLIQGAFTSNDNPVKVFIGGTVPAGFANHPDYPVLNSASPPTTPYPNSDASYGNMSDLADDPLFSFFQLSCPGISASGISPVCQGQSIQLNAIGGGAFSWTGPDSFTSVLQNPLVTGALPSMSGLYTVVVTPFAGCTGATRTVNIVVNPSPTVSVTSNSPVCVGNSINLSASGGTSYNWIGPKGFLSSLANPSIPDARTNMSGNYFVTVTDANNCSASMSVNVAINTLPDVSISGTSPICAGNTINLTSSGGIIYSWSGPQSYSSPVQNPSISNAQTAMSGTYTVTVTDANSCVSAKSVNITVNPLPVINISGTSPICIGNTINLTSSGGTGYSWSGPLGYSSSGQNPSILNAQPTMSGIYTVTVTDANSCVSERSVNITVNPLPDVTISGTTPICAGNIIRLTSSGGTGYSWSGPQSYSSSVQNPSLLNAMTTMSGTYTVTVTDVNNCVASKSINITVNPLPAITISGTSPVCAGNTINLASSGGTAYNWTGPGSFTSAMQNPVILNSTVHMSGTYTVTVTDANSCLDSKSVDITINPLPVVNLSSNSPVCAGNNINLFSSGGTGYSWTGPMSFTGSAQNPTIASAHPEMSGIYTVTVTSDNNCTDNKSINIVINPLPDIAVSSNSPLCAGQTLMLTASGGVNYTWTGPGGFSSTSSNPSIQNAGINISGEYVVTVTNQYNCSSSARQAVIIQPLPEAALTANSPVCSGDVLNLSASGGVAYSWVGQGGFASTSANISISNASTSMTGQYDVTVTGANGCSVSLSANVVVNALPDVGISVADKICISEGIVLSGNPAGGIFRILDGPGSLNGNNLTASTPGSIKLEYEYKSACTNKAVKIVQALDRPLANAGEDQYLKFDFDTKMQAALSSTETGKWALISGAGIIDNELSPVTGISNLGVGENIFSWTVSNGICEETSLVKINVDDLFVPSVITPNGDGKNDTFIINALIGPVRLSIFNKWGNEEYRNSDYVNEWNGINNKGEQLPEDTYFYIISLGNGTVRKGTVLMMR